MSPKPRPDRPARREESRFRGRPSGPGERSSGPRPPGSGPGWRGPGTGSGWRAPGSGPGHRVERPGAGHRPPPPWGEGRPPWPGADQPRADGSPPPFRRGPVGGPPGGPGGFRGDPRPPGGSFGPPGRSPRPGPPYRAAGPLPQPSRHGFGRPGPAAPPRFNVPVPTAEQLGPEEELVAGRRPVEEAFAARRPALRLLVTPQRRHALEQVVLHATTLRIPIVEVEGGTLTAITGFDGHQGVALVVQPRVFAGLDDILARAIERGEPPFVLVLDSLEDPQNLGTLLRSAEGAGVHGVIFPTAHQAPLSPAAVKASAGATEHLLLCPVEDLGGALADLHVRGLRVVGSEAGAPLTAREADLRGPIAIVIGSEGHGLAPVVRRRCDLMVRIPMRGAIGSLNAAVAGSVLLFEALGQRDPTARPTPASTPPQTRAAGRRAAKSGASSQDPEALDPSRSDPAASGLEADPGGDASDDDLLPGAPIDPA